MRAAAAWCVDFNISKKAGALLIGKSAEVGAWITITATQIDERVDGILCKTSESECWSARYCLKPPKGTDRISHAGIDGCLLIPLPLDFEFFKFRFSGHVVFEQTTVMYAAAVLFPFIPCPNMLPEFWIVEAVDVGFDAFD